MLHTTGGAMCKRCILRRAAIAKHFAQQCLRHLWRLLLFKALLADCCHNGRCVIATSNQSVKLACDFVQESSNCCARS